MEDNNIASTESAIETPVDTEVSTSTPSPATEGGSPEVDIDAMTDEEFDKHMDEEASEEPSNVVEDKPQEVDLDALYTAQMDSDDVKLDKPIYIKHNGQVFDINSVNELIFYIHLMQHKYGLFGSLSGHKVPSPDKEWLFWSQHAVKDNLQQG